MDGSVKRETRKLRAEIDSPETAAKLQQYEDLQVMRDRVNTYASQIKNTVEAYKTLPVINREYYEAIDEAFEKVTEADEGVAEAPKISTISYAEGVFSIPVVVESTDEFAQKYPSAIVQYLYDNYSDKFVKVEYNGYAASEAAPADGENPARAGKTAKTVSFSLTLTINNENQLPDLTVAEETPDDAPVAE